MLWRLQLRTLLLRKQWPKRHLRLRPKELKKQLQRKLLQRLQQKKPK
jgi:hypothetical protein